MAIPDVELLVNKPGGNVFNAMNTIRQGSNAIEKGALENKYAPLDKAIKAQNALSYSGKMGGIGNFLRGISELPVAERQAYLADPQNRKNYMTMLETFRQGINNPGGTGGTNVLTPEYVRSFGLGGGSSNPMSGQNMPQASNSNALGDNPPSPENANITTPEQLTGGEGFENIGKEIPGVPGTPEQPIPQPVEEVIDRNLLKSQFNTNNAGLSPSLKKRADAGIAFEKLLQTERPEIAKAYTDAFKYNSVYGRGKNWLDKFKQDQPEEYANYIHAKYTANTVLGNGLRFLEDMGISKEAQEDTKNAISQLDKLDVSPKTATKVFNKTIRLLNGVTEGVLDAAEPAYPGVRRKLGGVKKFEGEYIPLESGSSKPAKRPSTWDSQYEGQEPSKGSVWMIRPDGVKVEVHEKNVDYAKKKYNYRDINE